MKGESKVLRFLYGKDYEHNLGEGCINFTKECDKRNLYLGLSLIMLSINFVMTLTLFPLKTMFTMFTNWTQLITDLSVLLVICFGRKRDIKSNKGTLAFIHIVLEFALAFNIIVLVVYWSTLHFHFMRKF